MCCLKFLACTWIIKWCIKAKAIRLTLRVSTFFRSANKHQLAFIQGSYYFMDCFTALCCMISSAVHARKSLYDLSKVDNSHQLL
jgi:hypothetical protein